MIFIRQCHIFQPLSCVQFTGFTFHTFHTFHRHWVHLEYLDLTSCDAVSDAAWEACVAAAAATLTYRPFRHPLQYVRLAVFSYAVCLRFARPTLLISGRSCKYPFLSTLLVFRRLGQSRSRSVSAVVDNFKIPAH
jgi:hypothetical protein